MWLRCSRPNDYKNGHYEISSRKTAIPHKIELPCFLAYVTGTSQKVLLNFPKQKQKKVVTNKNVLRPPKGSQGESEGEEEILPKKKPNWSEIKIRLRKLGWHTQLLQWWCIKKAANPFPPRFKKRKILKISDNETGLEVMRSIGVFTLTMAPHCEDWDKQVPLIRRFWREVFLFFAGIHKKVHISSYEKTILVGYFKDNLPFIWQEVRKAYPFVELHTFPLAQRGFFARLFDIALEVRRHGMAHLYAPSTFRLVHDYTSRAYAYTREKYPFLKLNWKSFLGHVLVDAVCEHIWFEAWTLKHTRRVSDITLQRVWMDFFDNNAFILALERYCPRLTNEIVHATAIAPGRGFQKLNMWAVRDELYNLGEQWYNFPTVRKYSKVFTKPDYPRYEKRHCDPTFLRIEHAPHLLDTNWIRYPNQKIIFPRKLQVLRFSMPAVPLIHEKHVELWELILGCILKDRFFFQLRQRYKAMAIFIREDDGWYFNSSFYNFDRKEMLMKLADTMNLNL
jgi:hypothetical protein